MSEQRRQEDDRRPLGTLTSTCRIEAELLRAGIHRHKRVPSLSKQGLEGLRASPFFFILRFLCKHRMLGFLVDFILFFDEK